jgi:predicted dehydrogenase
MEENLMTETVRVGIIGTSWWATSMHLPALASHPNAEIVALCGRDPERGQKVANDFQVPQFYTDYREMIREAGLDAIVINTPDHQHHPMVMAALDAKFHLLCEKPLALNAGHARQMLDGAQTAGVKHMTYFTWRWLPCFRQMAALVADGYTGRLLSCHGRFDVHYGRKYHHYSWRSDPRTSNGIIGDLGSHVIDLARITMGEFARVSAHVTTLMPFADDSGRARPSTSDSALLTATFENGAHGQIAVSALAHTGKHDMMLALSLQGEQGRLEASFDGETMSLRGTRSDQEELAPLPLPDRFWGNADPRNPFSIYTTLPVGTRLFMDAIIEDRPVSPSFYDGWRAQQCVDAALTAHAEGRWVSVEGSSQ